MGSISRTKKGSLIGLDVGGTKMLGLVVDQQGEVQARVRNPVLARGNAAVAQDIINILAELIQAADARGEVIAGIAVCVPGLIDPQTGFVVEATNLDLHNLPLGDMITSAFGLPTLIMHDIKAATLGEARFGAAPNCAHMAFLSLGTGIAAGLILSGKLYGGAGGRAGEWGHTCIDRNGPLCPCGRRGCLEAVAAGPALARQAQQAIANGRPSQINSLVGGSSDQIDAECVARAAAAGDPLANEIVSTAASYLGQAIASLIHLLDLQRIVLGGGLAQIGPLLLDQIERAANAALLDEYRGRVAIVPSALGGDAGALGAAAAFGEWHTA